MSFPVQLLGLALTLLLPLAALWRAPAKPALQALAAALGFALIWALVQIDLRSPGIRLVSGSEDGAFQDTYYLVIHGRWLAVLIAIYLAVAALLWGQHRWLSDPAPRLTRLAFWLFHLGVLGVAFADMALGIGGMPRRYVDYEAALAPVQRIASLGRLAGLSGLAGLMLLLLTAGLQRVRRV